MTTARQIHILAVLAIIFVAAIVVVGVFVGTNFVVAEATRVGQHWCDRQWSVTNTHDDTMKTMRICPREAATP